PGDSPPSSFRTVSPPSGGPTRSSSSRVAGSSRRARTASYWLVAADTPRCLPFRPPAIWTPMPSLEKRSINARPGWRRALRAITSVTVIAARAAPAQMAGTTIILIVSQVAIPIRAVGMGLITAGVIQHRHRMAMVGMTLIVGQLLMTDWLSWIGLGQRMGLRERVGRAVTADIISLTMGVPGVEHLELPEFHDELRLLELYRGQLATLPDAVISNVGILVTVIATAGVLASVSPWLLALPLFGIPAAINGGWAEGRRQDVIEKVVQRRRFLNRYFDISL